MTPKEFEKRLAKMALDVKRAIDRDLPKVIANEAKQLFRENFEKEGFFGEKWKEVERRKTKKVTYTTKSGKTKTKTVTNAKGAAGSRKILHGQGRNLSRSLQSKTEPGRVIIYSDLPYSAAHNEGTNTAGRKRNVKIPKRQFVGEHPTLTAAVAAKIEEVMRGVFGV
jgi:phage gpG-like protein